MKFNIPKIVKTVEMKEYAPEMGENKLAVWVNPPARLIERWDELVALARAASGPEKSAEVTQADEEMRKILSELWSQGPEELRWTEDEVKQLEDQARETDPKLMSWMVAVSFREIFTHRMQIKKA